MSFKERDEHSSDVESVNGLALYVSEVDRPYALKCELINKCLQQEIGFGRYQYQLFILTGLGWMADNIWLQGVAVVLPQVQQELLPVRVEFATLALYVGLILGATTWGVMADLIGRKLSFNITLFLAGVFGIAAGAAPNFVAFAALVACTGFGIGGNLPVDGALYLEHIPQSHQWTLTLLSAWWAVGHCLKAANMGWRYTFYLLGALTFFMFIMRFVVFDLQESSKYLVAKGRDEDAIRVLQHLATRNGRTISLTLEQLQSVTEGKTIPPRTAWQTIRNSFTKFSLSHVRPLFSGRKLAINTTITILLWGLIGLGYPLFNGFLPLYLKQRVSSTGGGVASTYRNYTIISVLGIPGSLIACVAVDWTRNSNSRWSLGGRKLTMAVSTLLTVRFSSCPIFVKAADRRRPCRNAMYGVLYAYTPEVFPAPHRGTGDALASSFNRITGILAPVIKIATTSASGVAASNSTANGPIFVAASLFIVATFLMMFLPIETAGKAAM
ncbi:MFS general substrate transporter [Tricholoma matsutake]|nr:MFS general substrate transporter [Tricholoma matsutake 945]